MYEILMFRRKWALNLKITYDICMWYPISQNSFNLFQIQMLITFNFNDNYSKQTTYFEHT